MDLKIEEWHGTIKYGDYVSHKWYGFNSKDHPIVQDFLNEVLSKPHLFKDYELYLTGGILEGWMTWDVDMCLCGPFHKKRIKEILNWIIGTGFRHHIYADVIFADYVYNVNSLDVGRRWVYHISDFFEKNGEVKDYSNYKKVEEGLYINEQPIPYEKQLTKMKEGHIYKDPIRLI